MNIARRTQTSVHHKRHRLVLLWSVVAVLVILEIMLRLIWFPSHVLPVGYGLPLLMPVVLRHRGGLWFLAVAFAVISVLKFFYLIPPAEFEAAHFGANLRWIWLAMALLQIAVFAAIGDFAIRLWDTREQNRAELAVANEDLAAREEELARQNEELQSQAEELERQSEELRVTNEDLSRQERTLESLLNLSRSLSTELSRSDTMDRICQTLGELLGGPSMASAILQRDGENFMVRCHHGFGPAGLQQEAIAAEKSLAALVTSKGRTAYLEDISLRPDLQLPQPKEGAAMASVLAAPLRISGAAVGTLEVYAAAPYAWSGEQIHIVESLAAQTSVSLEAAELFETVARERRRLETMLKTVPFGIVVANRDCTDLRVNQAGAALLNVPVDTNIASEVMSASWRVSQDGKQLPKEHYPLVRALRDGHEVQGGEIEVLTTSGRRFTLLNSAAPIRDQQDRIIGAVGAFADITAQKELQRELDARRREAEEASVRKTRFLAAVSHDIRTPANAISLLAELIRRTASTPALNAEVPALARELQSSAQSLVNLLSDVLDVARFDSGKIELTETDFSVGELLAEEASRLQPLAREKQLAFECVPPAEPIWLHADRIKLSRVIGNLVGNAVKFTESGSIRVEASRPDGRAVIRVSDTGIGIAPEFQEHIFDEFFQLRNPERDRNKGTGLGLTICKRLVDAMGGDLRVESTPGRGSTFVVALPASCNIAAPNT